MVERLARRFDAFGERRRFACHVDRRTRVYEREIARRTRLTGQHGARDRGVLLRIAAPHAVTVGELYAELLWGYGVNVDPLAVDFDDPRRSRGGYLIEAVFARDDERAIHPKAGEHASAIASR